MKSKTIEVCERTMDYRMVPQIVDGVVIRMVREPKYHAQIKGKPGYWAAGDSIADAVGDLVRTHPEKFNIKINLLEKQAR